MTRLLYCSISSDLSEEEIIQIDQQVAKNRKTVYLFIKKLPKNSRHKAKRAFLYASLIFQLGQPLAPTTAAIMLPMPTNLNTLSYKNIKENTTHEHFYPRIVQINEVKIKKLIFTNPKQFDVDFNSEPAIIFIDTDVNRITIFRVEGEIRSVYPIIENVISKCLKTGRLRTF